ncbi:MAG: hypothetical protein HY303_01505 [Candidatus Wallbacteria bacterium]|nr:hypothetical protein [Candidatus Wallbacteria bacterium]
MRPLCLALSLAPAACAWLPSPPWPLRLLAILAALLLPGLPLALARRSPRRLEDSIFLGYGLTALLQPVALWLFRWCGAPATATSYAGFVFVSTLLSTLPGWRLPREAPSGADRQSLATVVAIVAFVLLLLGRPVLGDIDRFVFLPGWPFESVLQPGSAGLDIVSSLASPAVADPSRAVELTVRNPAPGPVPFLICLHVSAPKGRLLSLESSTASLGSADLGRRQYEDGPFWDRVYRAATRGNDMLVVPLAAPPGESVFRIGVRESFGEKPLPPGDLLEGLQVENFSDSNRQRFVDRLLARNLSVPDTGQVVNARESFFIGYRMIESRAFSFHNPPRGFYPMAVAELAAGSHVSSLHLLTLVQLGLTCLAALSLASLALPDPGSRATTRLLVAVAGVAQGMLAFYGPCAFLQDAGYTLDLLLTAQALAAGLLGQAVLFGTLASLCRQPGPVVVLLLLAGAWRAGLPSRVTVRLAAAVMGCVAAVYSVVGTSAWLDGRFREWLGLLFFEAVTEHTTQARHVPSVVGALHWLALLALLSGGLALAALWARGELARRIAPAFVGYALVLSLAPIQPHYFEPLVHFAALLACAAAARWPVTARPTAQVLALALAVLVLAGAFHELDLRHQIPGGHLPMPPQGVWP